MKFKIRFQRRYSVFITLMACAASVVMMMRNFGLPEETVIKYAWICLFLLAAILVVAAPLALIMRWLSNRREITSERPPAGEKQ